MIKSDIKNCTGIDIHPVSHEDINLGRSREMLPDCLYKFLHWVVCKDVNPYVVKNESAAEEKPHTYTRPRHKSLCWSRTDKT